MTTTIKADAIGWLSSNFGVKSPATYASKFYVPEKSRTKRSAWWVEIPRSTLQSPGSSEVHLLCQKAPDVADFHYLRVPIDFLRAQLSRLATRESNQISLFLSAEPEEMFMDQRGQGRVDFSGFLVT
jgi:hypothetical protein